MYRYFLWLFLTALMSLSINHCLLAQSPSIERVEPLHWWTEMHNPELQLMLYGNKIGGLSPKIDYDGVAITKTVPVENENYLFIYLKISGATEPGWFDITLTENKREVFSIPYELKKRNPRSALREGFNSSDVIYLITPDRFANGNPDNDRVEGYADTLDRTDDYARHGGDLQGIIDHLDYIEEMGYTAIWLNPVLENAMPRTSYHGYATTDFYKIDPRFGSNELYRKLALEAEKRGIKLIKDIITNHSGVRHWWMDDLPTDDWIHYPNAYQQTNHRRRTLHDPYASEIDRGRFTDGWFVSAMPDLNQDNPLLADYLIYNNIWWIEYAGLKGIRHDTHPYPGAAFLEKWTCRILEEYPRFNIVGEEWSLNPAVVARWQRGNSLPVPFGSCLPSLMDFPIQHSLVQAITERESWNSGFIDLYEKLTDDFLYPDPYNLVIFPDNHDMDRYYRQVNHDFDLFKMGMVYIATMRGIPQIYYGTEILMSNEKTGDHGEIRTDFPGGWRADTINAFTGYRLSSKKKEAQEFTRKLLNWRRDNPVIHTGKLMHYAPQHDGLYVYFRYDKEKTVMVILNKNDQIKALEIDYYAERIGEFVTGTDVLTGKTYDLKSLKIPARSATILELK